MNPFASRLATLMGSASFLTMTAVITAHAQQVAQAGMMAQATPEAVPEQVLITGSLIHGAAAVGVPVTNLGVQDFSQTGNVTIGDLFRTVPSAIVEAGAGATNSGGHQERETRVNIRGLDQTGPRSLLMIDGVRFPPQADGICAIDPSIIPSLALDRVDILADGASATYGSDAIAGVINVVLKRNYDGAVTLLHFGQPTDGGGTQYQASQLYGRTWDGGDITLTYEYLHEQPVLATVHSNYTMNYTPWGLDNPVPIGVSSPGTISTGKPNYGGGSAVGTGCTNCFAVPAGTGANFNSALNNGVGPLAPFSASTLNWASFATAGNMHTNLLDPLKYGWEDSEQDKNSFVATFDQRLFPGVSFFATGFYSNRRVQELRPFFYSNGVNNEAKTFIVPTINPYYPTGAPGNLRVSYELGFEVPPTIPAYELSYRYQFGLNLDLPFGWSGQIYDSRSYDTNKYTAHTVNDASVNVALGSTVTGQFGNPITKPAAVPYLNLFCDPRAFQCNSPTTLAYISSTRVLGDIYQIEEKGGRFDGPLFDLPGGQVKAAVGGTYESDNVYVFAANNANSDPNTGPGQPPLINLPDSEPYAVWAGFFQVDVPVFGDNFNIPGIARKLDLEVSWRHDQYHGTLNGGTSNPKVAFTWLIDDMVGATVRGSWGSSFRFANAGEYSTIASDANGDFNLPGQVQVALTCNGGQPTAGSLNAALFAAGFACNSTNAGGITWAGGPHPELRAYTTPSGQAMTREGGLALAPETALNYSAGFELAPQFEALRGLDLQATYYSVKINGTLLGFNGTNPAVLASPSDRFHTIVPSDLGCPVAANANPTSCAPFEKMAAAALLDRNSPLDISFLNQIYWLNDGSTVGTGFTHVSGIDWSASYDFDLGDLGAWNAGITGTYYLHRLDQTVPGTPIVDELHTTFSPVGGVAQEGVTSDPRMRWRSRLGWSDGPYSITGFVNYISHYYSPDALAPSNVNFQCVTSGGSIGGGTFPCAISNYTFIQPPWYTFDLSLGYNTGDMPGNDYLKNINIQFVITNLMGKHAAFQYGPGTSGRNVAAYDIQKPNTGRVIGITLVKTW